jgi:hypothetical protein
VNIKEKKRKEEEPPQETNEMFQSLPAELMKEEKKEDKDYHITRSNGLKV